MQKKECDIENNSKSCSFCSKNNYVCIIIFGLFLLLLNLNSCDENTSTIDPIDEPKIDSNFYLGIEIGTEFELANTQRERMTLKVKSKQAETWSLSFWDTIRKQTFDSWIIEQKVFEGNFPRLGYYAIAETDSGYHIGTKKHQLISTELTLEFFVPVCFIPKIPTSGTYVNSIYQSYNGNIFNNVDSTLIEVSDFPDSTQISIQTFAKREGFRDGTWEQNFLLLNKKGFLQFWNYSLVQ